MKMFRLKSRAGAATVASAAAISVVFAAGAARAEPASAPATRPGPDQSAAVLAAHQSAAAVPLDRLTVASTQVAFGLRRPTAMIAPDDGSGRLFIAEKTGTVRVYHPDSGLATDPLLDISDRVDISGNERGLIGIATAPGFATDPAIYLAYTALPDGAVTLSRLPLDAPDQQPVPVDTEEVLLTQPHAEFANHNGGQLAFGVDGHLYWSIGDGGGADDVLDTGQDLGTLLGKILRIDVSAACGALPYCVPEDNPFVDEPGARAEIWAYGLRNPWRFSVDPADGSLWIADVGQGSYEEVNHLRGVAGANLGWSCREGPVEFDPQRCDPAADYTDPVFHYQTSVGGCAVIGGHVYRGSAFADIAAGTYLATDYCSATAYAIRPTADGGYDTAVIGELPIQPTTIGVAGDGELYLVNDLPGQLHRISFAAEVDPDPTGECQIGYWVDSDWGAGFTSTVTIHNTGTEPIAGWSVGWDFTGAQRIEWPWNAVTTQQGTTVTAGNAAWNGAIPPGGTVSFGFLASSDGSGAGGLPAVFTLNGLECAVPEPSAG
ncbi:PQQ-dependent sugar dehydrogenase [Solwaraspora sp. WMMD406]|uniref:PQQ-dependent sugar dehydrogenase n=1 Tax=Solwaraspora sp. WMMD406 TaxID=3016095 RepID=UPI00241811FD|nr:PQQ-dependent sugar dehydrogenase [Solwaraspora sp. WMMD406]MDG4764032.1 PQQ-dependent sugar dehydrogenase [Solwaraspora sp. WMMD406]